jgi:thiol:disulfide interchange protein DsbD
MGLPWGGIPGVKAVKIMRPQLTQRPKPIIRTLLPALAFVCALLAAATPATAQSFGDVLNLNLSGGKADNTPRVEARLIADVAAIEPGKPFRLGVLFKMQPGWHIYWRNSGDTGDPTKIKWGLPDGFSAGELQWPAPERVEAFGLVNYGYHGEVLLFAEVMPPAVLLSSEVGFTADARWLVCKEVCVPGDAKLDLMLPMGAAAASEQTGLFDGAAAQVPLRLDGGKIPTELRELLEWVGPSEPLTIKPGQEQTVKVGVVTGGAWRIDTDAAGGREAGLFPLISGEWEATNPEQVELDGVQLIYIWQLKPRPQAADNGTVSAVVRLPLVNAAGGQSRVVAFEQPLPVRVEATAAAEQSQSPAGSFGVSGAERRASTAVEEQPGAKGALPTGSPQMSESTGAAAASPAAAVSGLSFLAERPLAASQGSLFYFLLLAFLGGIVLNVMPCVLPVISLKVMSFVRHAGEEPGRVLRMGLVYAAGVLVSFAALAAVVVSLKLTGAGLGWGFQMQEPRFVIAMAAIVLIFALSLFGLFTIEVPGAATSRLASLAPRDGYAGSFFNGVLATVLATPCSAPFLGPAVAFAFTQPVHAIPLIFLTVGLGLAFPYVLLSANPRWLRGLPKPGPWMETVKQLMGFALIATLVWLMWVLGGQIGAEGVVWTLAFLTAVAMGCWLLGKGLDSPAGRRRTLAVTAMAMAVAAYIVFPGGYLRSWEAATASAEDPAGPSLDSLASASAVADDGALNWIPFSIPAVEHLAASERTVFVDFTADWCLTCKVNERGALATDRVAEAFRRHDVALVKADWTNRNETIRTVLAQLGKSAVPVYAIFPAGRPGEPIVFDALITPGMIEERLQQAATTSVAYKP